MTNNKKIKTANYEATNYIRRKISDKKQIEAKKNIYKESALRLKKAMKEENWI